MGLLVALECHMRILCHAVTVLIALAEEHLGAGASVPGGFAEPLNRLFIVFLHADAPVETVAVVALGADVAPLGSLEVEYAY